MEQNMGDAADAARAAGPPDLSRASASSQSSIPIAEGRRVSRTRRTTARFLRGIEVARKILADPPSARMRPVVNPGPRFLGFLWEAQEGACSICGEQIPWLKRYALDDPLRPSIDHVVPMAKGGRNVFGNLLAAHRRCNGEKGSSPPDASQLLLLAAVNAKLEPIFGPAQAMSTGTAKTPKAVEGRSPASAVPNGDAPHA